MEGAGSSSPLSLASMHDDGAPLARSSTASATNLAPDYTAAHAVKALPNTVHVTFTVVRRPTPGLAPTHDGLIAAPPALRTSSREQADKARTAARHS